MSQTSGTQSELRVTEISHHHKLQHACRERRLCNGSQNKTVHSASHPCARVMICLAVSLQSYRMISVESPLCATDSIRLCGGPLWTPLLVWSATRPLSRTSNPTCHHGGSATNAPDSGAVTPETDKRKKHDGGVRPSVGSVRTFGRSWGNVDVMLEEVVLRGDRCRR